MARTSRRKPAAKQNPAKAARGNPTTSRRRKSTARRPNVKSRRRSAPSADRGSGPPSNRQLKSQYTREPGSRRKKINDLAQQIAAGLHENGGHLAPCRLGVFWNAQLGARLRVSADGNTRSGMINTGYCRQLQDMIFERLVKLEAPGQGIEKIIPLGDGPVTRRYLDAPDPTAHEGGRTTEEWHPVAGFAQDLDTLSFALAKLYGRGHVRSVLRRDHVQHVLTKEEQNQVIRALGVDQIENNDIIQTINSIEHKNLPSSNKKAAALKSLLMSVSGKNNVYEQMFMKKQLGDDTSELSARDVALLGTLGGGRSQPDALALMLASKSKSDVLALLGASGAGSASGDDMLLASVLNGPDGNQLPLTDMDGYMAALTMTGPSQSKAYPLLAMASIQGSENPNQLLPYILRQRLGASTATDQLLFKLNQLFEHEEKSYLEDMFRTSPYEGDWLTLEEPSVKSEEKSDGDDETEAQTRFQRQMAIAKIYEKNRLLSIFPTNERPHDSVRNIIESMFADNAPSDAFKAVVKSSLAQEEAKADQRVSRSLGQTRDTLARMRAFAQPRANFTNDTQPPPGPTVAGTLNRVPKRPEFISDLTLASDAIGGSRILPNP